VPKGAKRPLVLSIAQFRNVPERDCHCKQLLEGVQFVDGQFVLARWPSDLCFDRTSRLMCHICDLLPASSTRLLKHKM
jgi:hypothetical protein